MTSCEFPVSDHDEFIHALKRMNHSTPIKLSELIILGLLSHRPMSGYEIFRFIEKKADSSNAWLKLNKTTVYNKLSGMNEAGLVRLYERIEDQNKPPKNVYEITKEGIEQLKQILLTSSENPPGIFVNFFLDLPFYNVLEKDEIIRILKNHIDQLEILIRASSLYSTIMPDSLMKILIDSQEELFRTIQNSVRLILGRIEDDETAEFFTLGEFNEEKIFGQMKPTGCMRRDSP